MKRHGMLMGKFEFNSHERLMWTLPELHYASNRCHLKLNRFDCWLLFKRSMILWALQDSTRVIERSAEIKHENRS